MNDIEAIVPTLDPVDHDAPCCALIPSQRSNITSAVAQPKRQPIASTCCCADWPTPFELLHGFAGPRLPAFICRTPLDCGRRIYFDPVLTETHINQLSHSYQQMLGFVRRGDETPKELFDMSPLHVLYWNIMPSQGMVAHDPQLQELFDQSFILALACWIECQPFHRQFQPLKGCSKRCR
ncbi:hypothetical protein [Mesorhizobium amorphae]|uniref:hypothetical protein n=1 Tax=Mesorhizobium amorphae TaxID=71433 RepID=UPI0021B2024E|nr:hypothetical protein [Mesorhizobium amorphae]